MAWLATISRKNPPPLRLGLGNAEGIPRRTDIRELQRMKNSGNEAKKYLKTNNLTFLMLQFGCFLRANNAKSNPNSAKNAPFRANLIGYKGEEGLRSGRLKGG